MKLYQATCREVAVITRVQLLEGVPQQNLGRQKNVKNSATFLTTFDFDHKYLWNGSTLRKHENCVINYIPSPIGSKKLVKFGPLTKQL